MLGVKEYAIKHIIYIFMALMLQSCIVMKEEYYFPSANGGNVQKESCRGKVGADNKLAFDWDGVRAIFSVRKFGAALSFGATFEISTGSSVIWPTQVITVKTELGKTELSFDSFEKIVSYGDDFKTASYPLDTLLKNDTKKEVESYFQSVNLPTDSVEQIEVESIRVIVNGQEITLPKMRFEKTSGLFLHPLNC
ncbi:MAG: hypothetical protein K2W88_09500 [Pararheinheimera sp.]|nr:hypothetical protein [Rheinheimera sp.]